MTGTVTESIGPADLAEQRAKHLAEADHLKAQLEASKHTELGALEMRVTEFNRIFGETKVLADGKAQQPNRNSRTCSICHAPGHNKRKCPKKGAAQ